MTQNQLIFLLIVENGCQDLCVKMVILTAIIKKHQEEAKQEHKEEAEVMKGLRYLLNFVARF